MYIFLIPCWFLLIFSTQTRARLSFKRRPPTRQHRRSAGEERASGNALSPCELYSPKENGDTDQVFDYGQLENLKEAEEKDRDCEKPEDEVASDPDDSGDSEKEQEAQQAQNFEALEEEQQPSEPCTAQQMEGNVETNGKEEMSRDEHQGGNDTVWTVNVYFKKKKYMNKLFSAFD